MSDIEDISDKCWFLLWPPKLSGWVWKIKSTVCFRGLFPLLDADWPGPYILPMLWSCWNCWSCRVFLWLGKIRKWCRKHAESCGKTLGLQEWWGKGRLFSNPTFLFLFLLSLNLLAWPATCNRSNPDVIYEGHCQSCQVTCVMLEVHVQPCLVAHSSNPSNWEADAGGMGIQGLFFF